MQDGVINGRDSMREMRASFWSNLKEDARIFMDKEFGEASSLGRLVANWVKLFFVQGFVAMLVYRSGVVLYSTRLALLYPLRVLHFFLTKFVEVTTGIMLPVSAKVGRGLYVAHFGSVIVNGQSEIGDYCQIGVGVTLGTKGMGQKGAPKLGNHVYIGAGAKVLGPVRMGNNVGIGANSVVLTDVPDNVIVAGAPARIVKRLAPL
jgi:serine O-acetyltransferase